MKRLRGGYGGEGLGGYDIASAHNMMIYDLDTEPGYFVMILGTGGL